MWDIFDYVNKIIKDIAQKSREMEKEKRA